jgi:hypothetical protein
MKPILPPNLPPILPPPTYNKTNKIPRTKIPPEKKLNPKESNLPITTIKKPTNFCLKKVIWNTPVNKLDTPANRLDTPVNKQPKKKYIDTPRPYFLDIDEE